MGTNGGFPTYFKKWALPIDIDCVVNANILYFLSLLNKPIEKTLLNLFKYLKQIVIEDSFRKNTLSYEHYLSLTYVLSKAYKYGNFIKLKEIKDIVLNKISKFEIRNPLEASLLVLTLLNFDEKPDIKIIKYLIKKQNIDGGFKPYTFFSAPRDFYDKKVYFSSRALTTALAIEALTSYLVSIDIENIDKRLENPLIIEKTIIEKTNDVVLAKKVSNLVKYEGRYACLLDLYYETQKPIYLYEGEHQHSLLLSRLEKNQIKKLKFIEKSAKKYFKFEKIIQEKLNRRRKISGENVKKYLSKKSSDSYCYGNIASLFVDLGKSFLELLHIRQILSDVLDDINDYENDLKTK